MLAIALLLAVTSGAGCLGSSTPETGGSAPADATTRTAGPDLVSGTLAGRVQLITGPCVCPGPLRNGEFELRAGGRVVAVAKTDGHGFFRLRLAGGRYRPATARNGLYPLRARPIEVIRDHTRNIPVRFGYR